MSLELKLNREGKYYILGLPVKGDPGHFSEVAVSPAELGLPGKDMVSSGFESKDQAVQAMAKLQTSHHMSLNVYEVEVKRVSD